MKTSFEIAAELRSDQGKGASRRLRRSGKVPAIVYGGHEEARPIQLEQQKLTPLLDSEKFYSTILSIRIGSDKQPVVLKDLQRHPFKNQVLHVDFQRVREDEQIRMRVPLHFVNESVSVGVKQQGGVVSHLRNEVEVLCLPRDLPEFIEVDLLELGIGQIVHLSELKLPDGVQLPELIHGHDAPLVSVHAQRAAEVVAEEAPAAAGEAEAAPAAEPAEAEGDEK